MVRGSAKHSPAQLYSCVHAAIVSDARIRSRLAKRWQTARPLATCGLHRGSEKWLTVNGRGGSEGVGAFVGRLLLSTLRSGTIRSPECDALAAPCYSPKAQGSGSRGVPPQPRSVFVRGFPGRSSTPCIPSAVMFLCSSRCIPAEIFRQALLRGRQRPSADAFWSPLYLYAWRGDSAAITLCALLLCFTSFPPCERSFGYLLLSA